MGVELPFQQKLAESPSLSPECQARTVKGNGREELQQVECVRVRVRVYAKRQMPPRSLEDTGCTARCVHLKTTVANSEQR